MESCAELVRLPSAVCRLPGDPAARYGDQLPVSRVLRPVLGPNAAKTGSGTSWPKKPRRLALTACGSVFGMGRSMSRTILDRLVEMQEHLCFYCLLPFGTVTSKGTQNPVADHFIPWAAGGTSDINNGVASCMTCNSIKSGHIFTDPESARRYIVQRRLSKRIEVYWVPDVPITQDAEAWAKDYGRYLSE